MTDIAGRLAEATEIFSGLQKLDNDLRQTAGQNLGRANSDTFAGLNAQAALLQQLLTTLTARIEMLQKARSESVEKDMADYREQGEQDRQKARRPKPKLVEDDKEPA